MNRKQSKNITEPKRVPQAADAGMTVRQGSKQSLKHDNEAGLSEIIERHEEKMSVLEAEFNNTGNALLIWDAIRWCHSTTAMIEFTIKRDTPPLPLPDWCLRYLTDVAYRLHDLVRGLDERTEPDRTNDTMEEFFAHDHWRLNPTLNPDDAAERVPWAMGLARRGWNAFSRYRSSAASEMLSEEHEWLQEDGHSSNKAYGKLAELHNRDESVIRRRVAAVRKPAAKGFRKT